MVSETIERLTELPDSWTVASLFDVCTPQQWATVPTKALLQDGYPVYGANGQIGSYSRYNHEKPTILMTCRGATCGRLNVCKPFSYVTGNAMCLDNLEETVCDLRFLLYALTNRGLDDAITGSAQPQITRRNLEIVDFPLAPISEQRRIVATLDKHLESVRLVMDRLSRVSAILKRFRQAVLAAACSGGLTEDWRIGRGDLTSVSQSLGNIERLRREAAAPTKKDSDRKYAPPKTFEMHSLSALPTGWEYVSTDALFCFVTSGSRGWAQYYADAGPIFIRIGNLDHDSIELDLSDVQRVQPPGGLEQKRTAVREGDILISITADVGMVALVPAALGEAHINQHIALARPVDRCYGRYLAWYLASSEAQAQFVALQRGATKVGLGLEDIKSVAVPFPPQEEQNEIVKRLESLFSFADEIQTRVAKASMRCDKLTQSILAKAFRGELVPTEAELARREGREYEPASVLLERIRAERASRVNSPTRPKRNARRASAHV